MEDVLKQIEAKNAEVAAQGNEVRALKASGVDKIGLNRAVARLKALKQEAEELEKRLLPPGAEEKGKLDRGRFEDLMKRRAFYFPAFSIYGGTAGLYDYGPVGCAIKANVLAVWRSHFVLEEHMLEIDSPNITPHAVLAASGHVERFTDLMVRDTEDRSKFYRADHLLEAFLDRRLNEAGVSAEEKAEIRQVLNQIDNYREDDINALIQKYNVRAPDTGGSLTPAVQFNLMFGTSIGPESTTKAYLRPELAQGIITNFKRLLEFNQGRMPFAAAQIGTAFRNEISPRSGLLRVREFTLAEVEHFFRPGRDAHPKFDSVADVRVNLLSAGMQLDGQNAKTIAVREAHEGGLIANQTHAYFVGRVALFLWKVGVKQDRLRFRQHLPNEMAHYASDCWDAECLTSYGWVECVGCADRSCYDLSCHAKASGEDLVAREELKEPRVEEVVVAEPNKAAIGKKYRKDAAAILERLASLSESDCVALQTDLDSGKPHRLALGAQTVDLTADMVSVKRSTRKVCVEDYVPAVVEPSFGIGRILYAVLEHSFWIREGDEQRCVLSLPPVVAPVKCSVLPLSGHKDFAPFVRQLSLALTRLDVSHRVDDSSVSIGRRYARTDEIAIPFGITVDFDTAKTASVTLRERDSMQQVRIPLADVPGCVQALSTGDQTWASVCERYPIVQAAEE